MPIKWKEDTKDRKRKITRYFIAKVSEEELRESLTNDNIPGKKIQKASNELVRRGLTI